MVSPLLSKRDARRGVALVLVLGCIVLLSVLVVAFLASIKTETASSSGYASSTDVKQRSQTAVNMVIAQIQEAASGTNIGWTSQPGLIRTFDASGTATLSAYKLYSSGEMVAGSAFDPNAGTEIPADWKSRPAEYTDLNQPVLVADPNGPITRDGVPYTPNFPILDPGALGTVKGFAINSGTTPPDYASVDPIADNPAAMPVQWLYILQDGSVRAMSGGTVGGATKDNPIVSRIAFWTDDETCKVNINTAAGDEWGDTANPGSFMDTPRARNDFEANLKTSQPVLHEYQRYPGHPATTYLSAVFPWLKRAQIGEIVPRIVAGGSEGGSKPTFSGSTPLVGNLKMSDGLPLYASVDELRYVRSTSDRSKQADALFTPAQIEQSKFFLTASSRAPEINLFNKPRVSLWPQAADPELRTAFDKAIAFCSTIAGEPWYFVRSDPVSPTADYAGQPRNQALYAYLQELTARNVPGFGGSFLAKYPSPGPGLPTERDQILTELFDYSRSQINLIDSQIGADGTNRVKPYAGPLVWNMKLHTTGGPGQVVPIQITTTGTTMGFGRISTLYEAFLHIIALETIVEPDSIARYDKDGDGILKGSSTRAGANESANLARLLTTKLQVALLFNTYSVSQGPVRFVPNLIFEVSGLDTLRVAGQAVDFGGSTASTSFGRWAKDDEYAWGSASGPACLFWKRGSSEAKSLGAGNPSDHYPFISAPIILGAGVEAKSPLSLESKEMELRIYAADANGVKGDLVQTIPLRFPATTFPTPFVKGSYTRTYNNVPPYNDDPTIKSSAMASYSSDLNSSGFPYANGTGTYGYGETSIKEAVISSVTRGLGAGGVLGDIRLVAASHRVPQTAFTPLPGYSGTSTPITPAAVAPGAPPPPAYNYGFQYKISQDTDPSAPKSDGMISGSARTGNQRGTAVYAGSLVAGADYDRHKNKNDTNFAPAVSWGVTEAILTGRNGQPAPGDWDNGMGTIPDGAYTNKADEGEMGANTYGHYDYQTNNGTLFSPNRQIPSPVILGSLSTGVVRQLPWQTLLFCPNPAAKSQHPGFASPPDHLLLDLFWMPAVEPYAISEPFSTAGKINLNSQIVPFTHIERTTGLQAVLRSVRLAAIPTADALKYKSGTAPSSSPYRLPLDIGETLQGFQSRFASNRPFRSASEICEMFLVPAGKGATIDNIATWWDDYKLTGDNLRENPYNLLYSRLTTKSNTYTVHVRAQTLKKVDRDNPGRWVEGKDKIVGEHRGSYTIERYIDPNLESYNPGDPLTAYKFRTISTKHFTP